MLNTLKRMVVVACSLACFHLATAGTAEASGAVVSYRAPSEVVLHEPVIVQVSFSNETADSIHIDLGFNRQTGFALQIKLPDGSVVAPQIARRGLGRTGRLLLRPNDTASHDLLLNDWLSFDQLGLYEISIRLTQPIETQSGVLLETPTATRFTLLVGPADQATLRSVCGRLSEKILQSPRAEDRLDAARALSYVRDPVVLPFMRKVMASTNKQDAILIDGLVRLGDAGAKALLNEVLLSKDEERAALARSGLQRLTVVRR